MYQKVSAMAMSLVVVTAVQAGTAVHTGVIYYLGGVPIGSPYGDITQSSLDVYELTVQSPGSLTMDILSYEAGEDNEFNLVVSDVNNDGEIAYLDTKVMLLRDDGDLGPDDLVDQNEDDSSYPLEGAGDGSFCFQDAYLQLENLEAGNYMIAVGDAGFGVDDLIAGYNDFGSAPLTTTQQDWMNYDEFIHDHGDYQLTVSGSADFTVVPEPSTCMFLGTGLMLVKLRRKKHRSKM